MDAGHYPYDAGGYHDAGCRSDAGSAGAGASLPAWLSDPKGWEPEACEIPCTIYRAKLPNPEIPRRVWSPCGTGCTMADVPLLPGTSSSRVQIAATTIGGELYYRVSSDTGPYPDNAAANLDEIAHLPSDAVVTLLKHTSECLCGSDFDSPSLFFCLTNWSRGSPGESMMTVGVGSPELNAPVHWALPPLGLPSLGSQMFDFGGGWGQIDSQSVVEVATTRRARHRSPRSTPASPGR